MQTQLQCRWLGLGCKVRHADNLGRPAQMVHAASMEIKQDHLGKTDILGKINSIEHLVAMKLELCDSKDTTSGPELDSPRFNTDWKTSESQEDGSYS